MHVSSRYFALPVRARGCVYAPMLALVAIVLLVPPRDCRADIPFEGFLPFVGMGLSNEYDTFDTSATFFIAEPRFSPGGQALGPGSNGTYYDIALLDTGAATHILTQAATVGFNIDGRGFDGTNFQPVGGATGIIDLRINDPLGVYVAGMADRTSAGSSLVMNRPVMRGQSNFALLSAPAAWELPNIIGLPMAAQHAISIRNSEPQIFELAGRTVRTPNVDFIDLGSGSSQGFVRRLPLKIKPGIGFVQGPIYVQNFDITTLQFHENPLSPSILENGGLFVDVDMRDGVDAINDFEFLFDTGASLTVVSEQTAVRLGFDPILDTPDFVISVEGSGGVQDGIPGFYVEELKFDTVGGSFVVQNVPVAVLDVTNPNDPGNIVPGIIGTNLFGNRDLVIDAVPSIGQGGIGPSIFISDPVTSSRTWSSTAMSASWVSPSSWNAPGVPTSLWDATVSNIRGSDQEAVLSTDSTVYRTTISGTSAAEMSVRVATGATLTTFADALLKPGGRLHLDGGAVDAQFVQIEGGKLTGRGTISVGSGPITGAVRNLGGTIAPGDPENALSGPVDAVGTLTISGDLANIDGTIEIDLGGTSTNQYDRINVGRLAFLAGTLDVNLVDLDGSGVFAPSIGSTFTIISAADGIFGEFNSLKLPTTYTWDVSYTATTVQLQVTGLGLGDVCDLNGDGSCNAGDLRRLYDDIATQATGAASDLNGDGSTTNADIEEWLVLAGQTNDKVYLPGDANLDGSVAGSDFLTLAVAFGANGLPAAYWDQGNFDGNQGGAFLIGGPDFAALASNFGHVSVASVPEPASLIGILVGGALLLIHRRRRP